MRRPRLVLAGVFLALSAAGCGVAPGSPDPGAVVCGQLAFVCTLPPLSRQLRDAIVARDANRALPLAADLRRQVERVNDDPIETTFPVTYWELMRAIQGARFHYGFGAGAAQKGFLEHPWNEDDLATAVEMLTEGEDAVRRAEVANRRLADLGHVPCSD